MQTKKILSSLAFTAVAVNMVASVALAETATGSQELGCDALNTIFNTDEPENIPSNFQIGDDGTRSVQSKNDTAKVEADNNAYFEDPNSSLFDDITDKIVIQSNTPFSCGDTSRAVTLTVAASSFLSGGNGLLTYGTDGASGGGDDYYAMLSVKTAGETCSSSCTLASGSIETSTAKNGDNNFFLNDTANDSTLSGSFETTANLIDVDNTLNTVTLYNATQGFEGNVTFTDIDYNLAMPSNPAFTGTFTSTLTYTLS